MIWAWFACHSATAPDGGPLPPRHAAGWDALERAAQRRDLAAVQVLAGDVSLGPISADRPEADALAGALGFLQIAEDEEDLDEGMRRARAACTGCHRATGAGPLGP